MQYCLGDQIEKNERGGACSKYGGEDRCSRVLVGKPEVKRPLGRPRRRRKENIKMDTFGSAMWGGVYGLS